MALGYVSAFELHPGKQQLNNLKGLIYYPFKYEVRVHLDFLHQVICLTILSNLFPGGVPPTDTQSSELKIDSTVGTGSGQDPNLHAFGFKIISGMHDSSPGYIYSTIFCRSPSGCYQYE
jgi:hypothetical protein